MLISRSKGDVFFGDFFFEVTLFTNVPASKRSSFSNFKVYFSPLVAFITGSPIVDLIVFSFEL